MKRHHLLHTATLLACLSLASCVNEGPDDDPVNSDRLNEYTKAWINTFGLIDSNQDWCMVSAVKADASISGDIVRVDVYSASPAEGGHLIGSTGRQGTMLIDVSEGTDYVYARRRRSSGAVADQGYYQIVNGRVAIDGSGSKQRIASSRAEGDVVYAHDPSYFDAMIVCEDLGSIGDFDFNDIVLGLKHVSGGEGESPSLTIVPMAAGGVLATNIYFKNTPVGEIHDLIIPGTRPTMMLNTSTDNIGSVADMRYAVIDLSEFPGWTIANDWGDISIEVVNKEETVTLTAPKSGTAPQMICLGGDWFWPKERMDLKKVYKGFINWSCNAGDMTWIGAWVEGAVVKWNRPAVSEDNRPWFRVTTTDGEPYTLRLNGSDTPTEGVSAQTYYVETPWTSCKEMFTVYSEGYAYVYDRATEAYILGHPVAPNNIKTVVFSDNFDMSVVTTFEHMFDGCANLESVNIEAWEAKPTTALSNADAMFRGCKSITSLDLSGWDVSNVSVMYDAFSGCTALQTLNLDGWSFATGVDLNYFLENTSGLTVKCSAEAQTKLTGTPTLGGSGTSYIRP